MQLIEQIRLDALNARKQRLTMEADLLDALYTEVTKYCSDKRNKRATNEEVIIVTNRLIESAKNRLKSELTKSFAAFQISILERYSPIQLTQIELSTIISRIIGQWDYKDVSQVMSALELEYPNKYDSVVAEKIASDLLGN